MEPEETERVDAVQSNDKTGRQGETTGVSGSAGRSNEMGADLNKNKVLRGRIKYGGVEYGGQAQRQRRRHGETRIW